MIRHVKYIRWGTMRLYMVGGSVMSRYVSGQDHVQHIHDACVVLSALFS
jgi:hypothetical protein